MSLSYTAPTEITGDQGKAVAGTTTLNITGYTFEPKCEEHDVTASDSQGHEAWMGGCQGGSGSVNMNWRTDEKPTDDPPNIRPGSYITLQLYLGNTGKFFQFVALVTSTPLTSAVKQTVTFSFNYRSSGPITWPTAG